MNSSANDTWSLNNIWARLEKYLAVITDSPDLFARLILVITVYVLIMIPCMFVLLQWNVEVFFATEAISLPNYLFEAVVISVVFLFGVLMLYAVVYDRPQLHSAIFLISGTLVMLGAFILGQISNRCILNLGCDLWKYIAGLCMVSAVTFTGYVLPKLLNSPKPLYGLAFVVIAFTQSDLWLYVAYKNQGIPPSEGAIRALMLLFVSLFWLRVFSAGGGLTIEPEPKKKDPISWS